MLRKGAPGSWCVSACALFDSKFTDAVMPCIERTSIPTDTKMLCHYTIVIFLQNPHNRHLIARPSGRDMGCLLWVILKIGRHFRYINDKKVICSNYTSDSIETSVKFTSISQQNMATYRRWVFEIMVLNRQEVFIFLSNCVTSVTFVNLCKSFDFLLWIFIKSSHSSKPQWRVFFQCHGWVWSKSSLNWLR